MGQKELTLSFNCRACDEDALATVCCTGEGLRTPRQAALVAVNIPCPACGQLSRLLFDLGGVVHSVAPTARALCYHLSAN